MGVAARTPVRHRVEHRRTVAARPEVLYDLVADVSRWPAVFGPSVDVRVLEHDAVRERFEIWALVNDQVAHWTSRREFHRAGMRVHFEQERSQAPVAAMGGEWTFTPTAEGTEILLVHEYAVVDDEPRQLAWIRQALERNSPAELDALARVAEFGEPIEDVVFSFTDTVELPGSAVDVYEFIDRADLWAERLPHVAHSALREDVPGVQHLDMDTVTADGGEHTTSSVRLCTPGERIVFKQRVKPKLMIGHTGEWLFAETDQGSTVTVRHTVALDPTAVGEVLGKGATLADARAWAKDALSRNSLSTLSYAREFAEGRRRAKAAGRTASGRSARSGEPRLEEIADRVYAHIQPDGGWCLSNSGVIASDSGVVVVDSASTERRALLLRESVDSVAAGAGRIVVNTHHHGDHTFGNHVFGLETTVIAHAETRREMAETGLALTRLWPDVDWGDVRVTLPDLTFEHRLDLYAGSERIQLLHVGPAHTTNDTVAWLPRQGVLFAGDVVLNGCTPFLLFGSVTGTLAALSRLRSLDATTVVGGHGEIGGPELFDATESYLLWLRDLAADGVAVGLSPLELAREADLGEFAGLSDPERLVANLHRCYDELAGGKPGRPLDATAVFGEMVAYNGGALPTCLA